MPADSSFDGRPSARERLRRYLSLDTTSGMLLLVSAADKLNNLRAMTADLRAVGPQLWERFTTKDPQDHLWYYGELVKTYESRAGDHPGVAGLARELRAGYTALTALVDESAVAQ